MNTCKTLLSLTLFILIYYGCQRTPTSSEKNIQGVEKKILSDTSKAINLMLTDIYPTLFEVDTSADFIYLFRYSDTKFCQVNTTYLEGCIVGKEAKLDLNWHIVSIVPETDSCTKMFNYLDINYSQSMKDLWLNVNDKLCLSRVHVSSIENDSELMKLLEQTMGIEAVNKREKGSKAFLTLRYFNREQSLEQPNIDILAYDNLKGLQAIFNQMKEGRAPQ